MSLGLIQPGASAALGHPKTGQIIAPIGFIRGKAVWPVLGGAPDPNDPDDPDFTGEGDDDEDDDSEDNEDDDDADDKRRRKTKKSKSDDDDEDGDDDDDEGPPKAVRQAKRYRLALRAAEEREKELNNRLKKLENAGKDPGEVASQDLIDAREKVESLTEVNRIMSAQLAFFKTTTGIAWHDPADAFALAEREGLFDDVIDEDGTVDTRELRRGLKDLAKRKPHLVVPPKKSSSGRADEDEDDNDEGEEDERPRRSARPGNSRRRGSSTERTSRAALEKKFPVLRGR